jgi:hypothetical protein
MAFARRHRREVDLAQIDASDCSRRQREQPSGRTVSAWSFQTTVW